MTPNRFRSDQLKGVHDLSNAGETYKLVLLNTTYTPNRAHDFADDLVANELAGYTRPAITGRTVNIVGNLAVFDAADTALGTLNIGTIGYVAIIRDRGGADSANEVCFILDPPDLLTNNGVVTAVWNSAGIYNWGP